MKDPKTLKKGIEDLLEKAEEEIRYYTSITASRYVSKFLERKIEIRSKAECARYIRREMKKLLK